MTWPSDYDTQRAYPKGLRASGPKWLEAMYYSILFYVTSLYLRSERSVLLTTYKNVRNRICRQANKTANATELKDKYGLCTNVTHAWEIYFPTLFLHPLSEAFSVTGISEICTVAVLIIMRAKN